MEPVYHSSSDNASFATTIEVVLDQLYPRIFDKISTLLEVISNEEVVRTDEVIHSYIMWLQNALDDLYRKEKVLLFPKIVQFATEMSTAKYRPAVEWVYQAHRDMLQHLHEAKMYVLRQEMQAGKVCCTAPIYTSLQQLEQSVLQLKLVVEEQLLFPLESTF